MALKKKVRAARTAMNLAIASITYANNAFASLGTNPANGGALHHAEADVRATSIKHARAEAAYKSCIAFHVAH